MKIFKRHLSMEGGKINCDFSNIPEIILISEKKTS